MPAASTIDHVESASDFGGEGAGHKSSSQTNLREKREPAKKEALHLRLILFGGRRIKIFVGELRHHLPMYVHFSGLRGGLTNRMRSIFCVMVT
jgi:hypothetical protein